VAASEFAVNAEAARKEGKVVGYGVLIDSQWKALADLAQPKLGVQIENFRAPSARIISRVDTEKGAGQHLVDFIVVESSYVEAWAKSGFIDKLPAELLNRVPQKWRDPNGYYAVFTLFPTTVLYNKKLVSEADAPKSMNDLLDPRWKGKIAMTDPTLNETFLRWFYVERQKQGEDKAREFFTKLGAQGPTMFESGLTVSTNVNEGQFPVGIGFMTHVLSVGGPNSSLGYMKQDPMPAGNAAFTMASKAPHPAAQAALADLFLSTDYLQASGDLGYPITVPGVKSAIPGADQINYELLPDLPKEKFDETAAFLNTTLKK
jgi:iron(III) transport system substrate-binding protein